MTKLIYCVLLCHFIAAFSALGMPLFLPMVLPTLGAHIDANWAGALFILLYPFAPLWLHDFGGSLPINMADVALYCVLSLDSQRGLLYVAWQTI